MLVLAPRPTAITLVLSKDTPLANDVRQVSNRNDVAGFTTGAGGANSTGSPSSPDNPGMRRNPDGTFGGTPENLTRAD